MVKPPIRSQRPPGWSLAIGFLLLAVLLLWLAAPTVITGFLERELRQAGWADPEVRGLSLTTSGVLIDRVRLSAGEAVVAEEVRARIGTRGIEDVTIGRLRAVAEFAADGAVRLPGLAVSDGAGEVGDVLPAQQIHVARAEIRLVTGVGEADLFLSDLLLQERAQGLALEGGYSIDHPAGRLRGTASAERASDGSIRVRLRVEGGQIDAGPVRVADVTGEAAGEFDTQGEGVLDLRLEAGAAALAEVPLGTLVLGADWREGVVQFAVTTPDPRTADVAIEGRAELRNGAPRLAVAGHVALNAAAVGGDLSFDAELASDSARWSPVRGRVQMTGRDLAVRGTFRDAAFDVSADVAGDLMRGLSITTQDAWHAQLVPAADWLPADLRALADRPISVSIAPVAGEPLALRVALADQSLHWHGGLDASAGDAIVRATAKLAASWSTEPVAAVEISHLTVETLPWKAVVLDVEDFEGTASYSAHAWRVDGAGTVHAAGAVAAARFEGLTARWSGTVSGTPEHIDLAPDECVEWTVASVEVGATRLAHLTPPCIQPGDGPVVLSYGLASGRMRFAASAAPHPLAAELAADAYEIFLHGTWPALDVAGVWQQEALDSLTVRASDGAVALRGIDMISRGIDGSAEVAGGALLSVALNVASIEHLGEPALWAPVELEVAASGEEAGVVFDAILSGALGAVVLEASGRYADGQGRSHITLHPVELISGAIEMRDLSPRLARHIEGAIGTLGFEGDVRWSADGVQSTGSLSVRGLAATIGGIGLAGVNATTSFSALWPPTTVADQRIEIDRIDLGMPLEHGVAVYDVDADGRFTVRRLEFAFAGGRLYAEPFTFDSAEIGDIGFVLRADAVELSNVLALSRIEGLEGSGRLSGRIPVRVSDQGLAFDGGNLAAVAEGVLHYVPEDLPAFLEGDDLRASMLREVLTNFHYEELSVTFAGDTAGGQGLRLSARGANPEFLDGHPIELAFNFRGPLLEAVRSAVDISTAVELEGFDLQEMNDEETTQ